MYYVKGIIILTLLALAVSQAVASEVAQAKACIKLDKALWPIAHTETPKVVFEYAQAFKNLKKNPFSSEEVKKMINALEAILNKEDCSESSLDFLEMMSRCTDVRKLYMIDDAVDVYKNKCLSPLLVNQMVKSAVKGRTVDILSPAVVQEDASEYNTWANDYKPTCVAQLKFSEIMFNMRDEFQKKFSNPEDAMSNGEPSPVLKKYLDETVFEPCARYVESVGPFMERLRSSVALYNIDGLGGAFAEMVRTIDREARDAIYRHIYCRDACYYKEQVEKNFAEILTTSS